MTRKIQLSTTPTPDALAELQLGDIVYLDGLMYTAREGVYMRALEEIEVGYCQTGGMQMSVHAFCLSSRRAVARVHADGRVEHWTDPDWFTPYQRRETVGWEEMSVAAE